jgi:hypothetical protein
MPTLEDCDDDESDDNDEDINDEGVGDESVDGDVDEFAELSEVKRAELLAETVVVRATVSKVRSLDILYICKTHPMP